MAICPKCGKEIDYLTYHGSVLEHGSAYFNDGNIEYHDQDYDGFERVEFDCPLCGEFLTADADEAERFMNGEIDKFGERE